MSEQPEPTGDKIYYPPETTVPHPGTLVEKVLDAPGPGPVE